MNTETALEKLSNNLMKFVRRVSDHSDFDKVTKSKELMALAQYHSSEYFPNRIPGIPGAVEVTAGITKDPQNVRIVHPFFPGGYMLARARLRDPEDEGTREALLFLVKELGERESLTKILELCGTKLSSNPLQ